MDDLINISNDMIENDMGLHIFALVIAADSASEDLALPAGPLYSIPISRRDVVMGYLQLPQQQWDLFADEDRLFLNTVAGQMAVAFDNARLYAQTKELSIRDELTGLFNRRHLDRALKTEWARAVRFNRPLAVAMLDIDHFKKFNDAHGHLEGDRALQEIARLIVGHTREVDTVARFGGEEFAVILSNAGAETAGLVAEKLRALTAAHSITLRDGKIVHISVSIGIAAYPGDASSLEELLDRSDSALYDAKRAGRNRVVVFGSQSSAVTLSRSP